MRLIFLTILQFGCVESFDEKMASKRAKKVSPREIEILTSVIAKHKIIEEKRKTSDIERKKKEAWDNILDEFNSMENVERRDLKQLKVSNKL